MCELGRLIISSDVSFSEFAAEETFDGKEIGPTSELMFRAMGWIKLYGAVDFERGKADVTVGPTPT